MKNKIKNKIRNVLNDEAKLKNSIQRIQEENREKLMIIIRNTYIDAITNRNTNRQKHGQKQNHKDGHRYSCQFANIDSQKKSGTRKHIVHTHVHKTT